MGQVTHWVHKINWTLVIAAGIISASFVQSASIIAGAMKPDVVVVTVNNEPRKPVQNIYRVKPDGKLEKIK